MNPRPALAGLLCAIMAASASAAPATPTAPAEKTIPDPTNKLIQQRLNSIERDIATLLGQQHPPVVQSALLSYRLVEQHLYQSALQTTDAPLRAQMLFKANVLADALPTFDALLSHAAEWTAAAQDARAKAAAAAAIDALARFGAAPTDGPPPANADELTTYIHSTLGLLAPLSALDASPKPAIYPIAEIAEKNSPAKLPTVDAASQRVQQANLTVGLRDALVAALPDLRTRLSNPATAPSATTYFHDYLDTLDLAEKIGASSVLTADGKSDLEEQLGVALILFKDARLRSTAAHRLSGIAALAGILARMEQVPLTTDQHATLSTMVQTAVNQILEPMTADDGRTVLVALDHLLQARQQTAQLAAAPTLPRAQPNQQLIAHQAAKLVDDRMLSLAAILQADEIKKVELKASKLKSAATQSADATSVDPAPVDIASIEQTASHVNALNDALSRFNAMPDLLQEAQAAKLRGENVEMKLLVWAKAMTGNPSAATTATSDFDAFRDALKLLDQANAFTPTAASEVESDAANSPNYTSIVTKFTASRQRLSQALAGRDVPLGPVAAEVQHQLALLEPAADLHAISDKTDPLVALNRWGGWRLSTEADVLLRTTLNTALAAEYEKVSGKPPALVPLKSPVDFKSAAAATSHLAILTGTLTPALANVPPSWPVEYETLVTPPPPSAVFYADISSIHEACVMLEFATAARARKNVAAADYFLQRGIAALTRLKLATPTPL